LQPDGKVLIGGTFTINNGTVNSVARLNSDGSQDVTFTPGTATNGSVSTIALRPDGKMMVGGFFAGYNNIIRNRLALLNTDGSLNLDFNPGTGTNGSEPTINTIVLQPDNKVLLGGSFTAYTGVTRNRIARLTAHTNLPSPFGKISPADTADDLFMEATLEWQASDDQAMSYEYCYDTIDNGTCDSSWMDNGLNTSVYIKGLSHWNTYYWQVRAINGLGETYANDGIWWWFSTNSRVISPCGNSEWSCENIDVIDGNYQGYRSSMELDSQGFLHVAYLQMNVVNMTWSYYLKSAFWDGSKWNIQTIENVGNWHALPSIKIDRNDNAHISYFSNSQFKYASWNGSGWETINVGTEKGKYPSMDLDSNNNPHIVYCSGSSLKYAVWNGSIWNIQTVNTNADCGGDFGGEITLVLDSNDNPHILFLEQAPDYNDGATYEYWDGNNWIHQIIGMGDWVGGHSIALDNNGNPHIIYTDINNYSLIHASWNGYGWDYSTIISYGNSLRSPYPDTLGIVFDNSDHLHLSFSTSSSSGLDLRHAEWDGVSWIIEVVDNVSVGSFTKAPIVVDSNRIVSICYPTGYYFGEDLYSALKCAWNEPPPVTTDWVVKAPMSIARTRLAAAVVNGKVYVIGGRSFTNGSNVIENSVEEYDPTTNTWTRKADKPTEVSDTAAVINNKIYVPGGYNYGDPSQVSVVEVYDPAINSWSSVAPLPTAQSMHTVAAVNNKLYVMGGSTGRGPLNTCYVYDPTSNQWSICAPMTYARMGAGAGVVNGKIYVVGGLGSLGNVNYVEEYNPTANTWTTKAPLSTARSFHGTIGYGNYLYVCGGDYELPYSEKSCEKYDPISNSWVIFDHLNIDRQGLAMVATSGRLYAEGGEVGHYGGHSAINEEFKMFMVSSIARVNSNPTNLASVDFTLTLSESVTGVNTSAPFSDFALTTTGVTGAAITSVSGSGTTYTVTVNTGSGNGTIRLDVVDDNTIIDAAGNPLGGVNAGDGNFTGGETYTIIKIPTFADVSNSYWAWGYIERLYNAGITSGCGGGNYCPEMTVTRAQMAIFLLKGMHGSSYTPPAVGAGTGFGDVTTDHWAAAWIKQLALEGITSGCGGGNYCPEATVTRAQMAVFLLRAEHGTGYTPPSATGVFGDVAVGYWADRWIERLALEGITSGCGGGNYCPDGLVTRAQMAIFLVKTFNLP